MSDSGAGPEREPNPAAGPGPGQEPQPGPDAPRSAAEEMDWWLGGPGMRQLGAGLLLGAGALFVLAVADRWPPPLREGATKALGGALCFLLGWVAAPVVLLTDLPVRLAWRKNQLLGCLAREVWRIASCFGVLVLYLVTGYSTAAVLGFVAGLVLRWSRPAVAQAGRESGAASDGVVLTAGLLLAMAELAALGLWLVNGDRMAGLVWAGTALAVPPLAGFALRSLLWPQLALLLAFATAIALAGWTGPDTGPPGLLASAPTWREGLAIGLLGAMLAAAAVWLARRRLAR
ncbi:MAG: hypothetical protein ACKOWF_05465 [Chloroflexota bacterium]